jgi:hypothetical protein
MSKDDLASMTGRFERLASEASVFEERVFRSATPRYAKETDLLTGEGSRKHGGR